MATVQKTSFLWNIFILFSAGASLAALTFIASAVYYIRIALEN
jgi:hypothetical protein